MKLGEALSLRATQAQHLNNLKQRLGNAVLVQEGDPPVEKVDDLMNEYLALSRDHAVLIGRIAATNAGTTTVDGGTLLDLLHERERLTRARNLYAYAAARGNASNMRFGRNEIKFLPQVDASEMHKQEESNAEQVRALDARIQAINWATDLL